VQAIAELIGAFVAAFALTFVAMVEAIAALLALVAEFIFVALTQGLSAASERYKERLTERGSRRAAATAWTDATTTETRPSISLKQAAIIGAIVGAIVVVSVGFGVITWVVQGRIRQQRIEATRSQVAELADSFSNQIKDRNVAAPVPGGLPNRDAWNQPMELFVDKTLLGSLVVVRSSGPDRKSGTIDDILAIRFIRANAKDVGGELADRGIKGIRDRVAPLLPGGEQEKPPRHRDVDIVE
jgi:hypothetical protein